MRVTVERREEPTLIGRRSFFLDFTVLFSEHEKAVIRERQMGKHYIQVGSDIPRGTGIDDYGPIAATLRVISRVAIFGFVITLILHVPDVVSEKWVWFCLLVAVVPFAYRKYAEWQYDKSLFFRNIELGHLVHNSTFTVYAADALQAREAEVATMAQLQELKNRLIAVSPDLAQKQVYKI